MKTTESGASTSQTAWPSGSSCGVACWPALHNARAGVQCGSGFSTAAFKTSGAKWRELATAEAQNHVACGSLPRAGQRSDSEPRGVGLALKLKYGIRAGARMRYDFDDHLGLRLARKHTRGPERRSKVTHRMSKPIVVALPAQEQSHAPTSGPRPGLWPDRPSCHTLSICQSHFGRLALSESAVAGLLHVCSSL